MECVDRVSCTVPHCATCDDNDPSVCTACEDKFGLGGGKCYPFKGCLKDETTEYYNVWTQSNKFEFSSLFLTPPSQAVTPNRRLASIDMTTSKDPIGECRQYCVDTFPKEAAYFTLAHGNECHCMAMFGADWARLRIKIEDGDINCDTPCPGNPNVKCGSATTGVVYATDAYPHVTYLGCHKDGSGEDRQLTIVDDNGEMMYKDVGGNEASLISIDELDDFPGLCSHVCKTRFPELYTAGNLLSGLSGGRCYCGHKERFGRNPPSLAPNPSCWNRCGDTDQKCGGDSNVSVYMVDFRQ
eukprot:GDKI01005370.1.p2 GENE.GDKI01005370.1~~GDKI01005370.1.p2  ORF type:complete len:298 (-),score=93.91 GDKI01005370.1:389-1282(-)